MLFSIASVSTVCLALAWSGWVSPESPVESSVTSTGLVTLGQPRENDGYDPISWMIDWMMTLLVESFRPTHIDYGQYCACDRESDRPPHWSPIRFLVDSHDSSANGLSGIEILSCRLAFTVDFIQTNVDKIISRADDTDNFPAATWYSTVTDGLIDTRFWNFFQDRIYALLLTNLVIFYFIGNNKQAVNAHYVYSIDDVEKALGKRMRIKSRGRNAEKKPHGYTTRFQTGGQPDFIGAGKLSVQGKPPTFGEYLAHSPACVIPSYEESYNFSRYERMPQ